LNHRLIVAGSKGRIRFQEQAVQVLHKATGGVPRLINLTADRSLLAGYSAQTRAIGEPHVRQALASLSGEEGIDAEATAGKLTTPRNATWWWRLGGAAAAVLLAAALWWQFNGTAEYLAFRASRAPAAADAEHDYGRIVLEYRGSRQRENALLRLAQFQVARGAHAEALTSLGTLAREFPNGAAVGESYYWAAKVLLARGDTTAACASVKKVPAAAGVAHTADYVEMAHNCVTFEATVLGSDSTGVRRVAPAPNSVP
jgi:TolA-binding protein